MPFPTPSPRNDIVPPEGRAEFAAEFWRTRECPLCKNGPASGRSRFHEHIDYHCTPVECECGDSPPLMAFGECSKCRRPRISEEYRQELLAKSSTV